jgi:tight adherence protein B
LTLLGEVPVATYVPLFAAALFGLAVLSLSAGLYRLLRPAGELEGRLESTVRRTALPPLPLHKRLVRAFENIKLDSRLAGGVAMDLERANIALTVNEYVLMRFGGAVLGFLLAVLVLHNIVFGVMLAVLALLVPPLIVSRKRHQRQHQFQRQMVDVITMLSSGLRAGIGLLQAMDLVRREMTAPASEEYGRVVREVGLGVPLPQALGRLLARMPSDDLAMVVTVIDIQAEVGGNLASILENVVTTIRERVQLAQEIRSLTAQQRMTGYVLAGLPFIVGAAIWLLNPKYMLPLFNGIWIILPIMAVVMMAVGFFIINRIVDIKV